MAFLETQLRYVKERFSLLLLEPGEIYFEDFSAFCCDGENVPANGIPKLDIKGRLKVCSKSVIYDPKDQKLPICKFLYRDIKRIEKWKSKNRFEYPGECILIEVDLYAAMKENNLITPYAFYRSKTFVLTLEFGSTDDCVPQLCQLQRASTLPIGDQTAMINAIVLHKQQLVKFDTNWLGSLYETVVYETQCDRITPLVTNPGRVVLTSNFLYYQAFNNIDPVPVVKVRVSHIRSLVKRRFCLRRIGLELHCREDSTVPHLYLALRTQTSRDELYEYIKQQEETRLDDLQQQNMTLQWQNGLISNFEYLMYLNSMADRSINDLTQYPVFPWVITDYTSQELDLKNPQTFRDLTKPIGALTPERLTKLLQRCEDMSENKFLYGSHYSTPGYVLFYLVRAAPEYMLCLQNGRFDQPDRMFNSLKDAWQNCLTSYSDFKELIPEFYEGNGEFLRNSQGIDFGKRSDGTTVGDVDLPPWAKDAADFVRQLGLALEAPCVSEHLHHWIDLIFGYKQQGPAAEEAHNLFYYLTYEGAVNIEQYTDLNERIALEQQIMEFGQTPKQLFTEPHPCKLHHSGTTQGTHQSATSSQSGDVTNPPCFKSPEEQELTDGILQEPLGAVSLSTSGETLWTKMAAALRHCDVISEHSLHKGSVTAVVWSDQGEALYSVDTEGVLKLYSVISQKQLLSVNVINAPLRCVLVLEDLKTVIVAGDDNFLYIYSLEFGRQLGSHYAHDDHILNLLPLPPSGGDQQRFCSASRDGSLRLWRCSGKPAYQILLDSELEVGATNDVCGEVTCVDVAISSVDSENVTIGTNKGTVEVWDFNTQTLRSRFHAHDGPVFCVRLCADGVRVLSSGQDRAIKVTDVSTCAPLSTKYADTPARWLEWDERNVLAGLENGLLELWDMNQGMAPIATKQVHKGAVNMIAIYHTKKLIVSAGEDHRISVIQLS